jgi:hypothetical protein
LIRFIDDFPDTAFPDMLLKAQSALLQYTRDASGQADRPRPQRGDGHHQAPRTSGALAA